MDEKDAKKLASALELTDKMGKPDALTSLPTTPVDPGYFVCNACKKKTSMELLGQVHSELLQANLPDAMCPECRNTAKDFFNVVCVTCRKLVAKLTPYTSPDGFKTLSGKTYHIAKCPVCDGTVTSAKLLEYGLFTQLKK